MNALPMALIQRMMKKSSKDAGKVVQTAGSTHALETMYTRYQRNLFSRGIVQGIADIFWHHVVGQPKALRNRLEVVRVELFEKLLKIHSTMGQERAVRILSVAGGSSRSIIMSIQSLHEKGEQFPVEVVTLDKDATALEVGKKVANAYQLGHIFTWIHGTAGDLETLFSKERFDIVEIVGLLDYFTKERAEKLLRNVRAVMNPGGYVIIANVIPNVEERFVYKMGWPHMFYRTPEEVDAMLAESGFSSERDIIIEPLKVHCVGIARK